MLNVLLVEDDLFNQTVASDMIQILHPDARIVIACDGAEALGRLDGETFDIILSDIQMPGMDGYEFIRRVRTDHRIDTPIIAVTAYAVVGDREKLMLQGFDGYLAKPILLDKLQGILESYLKEGAV